MRVLLALILVFSTIGAVRGEAYNVLPGLSVKNFLLYSAAGVVFLRAILARRVALLMPEVLFALGFLVIYAVASTFAVENFGSYAHYDFKASILRIKSEQLDWLFYFLAFSVGTRDRAEAGKMLRLLLLLVGIANIITIWNTAGLPRIGTNAFNPELPDGSLRRVDGFFGHANETGSLICALVPLYLATIAETRGAQRIAWVGMIMFSLMVLIGTVSRGAIVGLVLGGLWAAYLSRSYVRIGPLVKWLAIAVLLGAIILPFVGGGYVEKFIVRFTGMNTVSARDISSGRSDMWVAALRVMIAHPWSFISGVGWNTWRLQSIDALVPHNQYLTVYFDLGLPGILCFLYALRCVYAANRDAVLRAASVADRRIPMAVTFAILIYCVAAFFSTMSISWIFMWPMLGLAARYAMSPAVSGAAVAPVEKPAPAPRSRSVTVDKLRDPYSLPRRQPTASPSAPVVSGLRR